jgi:NAD(P)-dependent dehydrogenase (short-subunit alcohol dehydrogenase family)
VTQTDGLIAPKEMIDSLIAQTPMGRLATPEDVANTILLLSLPEASWISAQVLQANGGMM